MNFPSNCPKCNAILAPGCTFCPQCGASVQVESTTQNPTEGQDAAEASQPQQPQQGNVSPKTNVFGQKMQDAKKTIAPLLEKAKGFFQSLGKNPKVQRLLEKIKALPKWVRIAVPAAALVFIVAIFALILFLIFHTPYEELPEQWKRELDKSYGKDSAGALMTCLCKREIDYCLGKEKMDPNKKVPGLEDSLWEMALREGNVVLLKELADHGAKIKTFDFEDKDETNDFSGAHVAAVLDSSDLEKKCTNNAANQADKFGMTPLFYVRSVGAAETLIENGAKIDKVSNRGFTPLDIAILSGDAKLVAFYLKNDAKIKVSDKQFPTLCLAAETGNVKCLELLLDKIKEDDGDVDKYGRGEETPLGYAIACQNAKSAKLLIEAGADVNKKFNGDPLLCVAARNGDMDCVKLLLKNEADGTKKTKDGETAYLCALRSGNVKLVKYLAKEFEATRIPKEKLFDIASDAIRKSDSGDIIDYLLDLEDIDFKVDAKDEYTGQTLLQIAAECGNYGAAKALVENGAKIKGTDKHDCSVWHYALKGGNVKLFKYLQKKEKQSIFALKDKSGKSPFEWLAYCGNEEMWEYIFDEYEDKIKASQKEGLLFSIIEPGGDVIYDVVIPGTSNFNLLMFLLDQKVDVSAHRDTDGMTPLHVLATQKHANVRFARLLLDKGADVNAKDKSGRTPLAYAEGEMKKLLRENGAK